MDGPQVAVEGAEEMLARRLRRLCPSQQVTCCCFDEGQGGILDLY